MNIYDITYHKKSWNFSNLVGWLLNFHLVGGGFNSPPYNPLRREKKKKSIPLETVYHNHVISAWWPQILQFQQILQNLKSLTIMASNIPSGLFVNSMLYHHTLEKGTISLCVFFFYLDRQKSKFLVWYWAYLAKFLESKKKKII